MSGKKSTEQLGSANKQLSSKSPARATVSFFHRSLTTVSVQTPVIKTKQDIEELVRQAHQLMQEIVNNLEQGMLLGDHEEGLRKVGEHLNNAHEFLAVSKTEHPDLHQQLVELQEKMNEIQQRISPMPEAK